MAYSIDLKCLAPNNLQAKLSFMVKRSILQFHFVMHATAFINHYVPGTEMYIEFKDELRSGLVLWESPPTTTGLTDHQM